MKYVDPPFGLGESLSGTDDDSNETNGHWEGAIYEFPDVDASPALRGGKSRRSGQQIRAMVVRNRSGGNLVVAKKCLKIDLTPTSTRKFMGAVDGQCSAVNQVGGIGDPELTGTLLTTGIADKDLFWLIIGGPCECLVKASEAHLVGSLLCSSATAGALALATFGSDTIGMHSAANVIARATIANGTTSAAAVVVNVCSQIG
jgi:hypothetical protein